MEKLLFLVGPKSSRMALEEKSGSKRRKKRERELDWVRQGAKGVKRSRARLQITIKC
jgi:hypothetical protein